MNVDVPMDLCKQLRFRAGSEGRIIRSIVVEAIVTYLNK